MTSDQYELKKKLSVHTLLSLERYATERWPVGGFLTAVLENKLFEATCRADLENRRTLCDICMYIFNYLPDECWGSPEKVKTWLDGRTK